MLPIYLGFSKKENSLYGDFNFEFFFLLALNKEHTISGINAVGNIDGLVILFFQQIYMREISKIYFYMKFELIVFF